MHLLAMISYFIVCISREETPLPNIINPTHAPMLEINQITQDKPQEISGH